MRKKSVIKKLLALTLTAGLLLTGCGNSEGGSADSGSADAGSSSETSVIRKGIMTGTVEHFLTVIGQEKGIWKENGLDIQVTEFGTGVEAVGAMTTGQLDTAEVMDFGLVNRVGQTVDKIDLKIIAQNFVAKTGQTIDNVTAFYVNPETISSKDDIKGKKISVCLGTQNEYQNAKLYEFVGITKEDITEVPIQGMSDVAAVAKNGEIDGAWAGGQSAQILKDAGWTALISGDEVGLLNRAIAVSTTDFATNHQDALEKFFKARQQVVEYVNSNLDEAAGIVTKKTGVTEEMFKNSIATNDIENVVDKSTYDDLNELKNWCVNNGLFGDFDLDGFYATDALAKAFPDKVTYK